MAKNKLPIYELDINEDEFNKSGVQYVALVDDPAVQMNWETFSNDVPMQFVADNERRIVTGVLMRADYPIFRSDPQRGDHYVVFSKDNIEKIVQKFAKLGYHNNVNMMHEAEDVPDGVSMFESFIVDSTRGIQAPKGMKVEDGSWIGSYKIDNDAVWAEIKAGKFNGFSVEGFFGYKFGNEAVQKFIEPNANESQSDFMSRCVPHYINDGKDQDQAVAMCISMYDKAQGFEAQIDSVISILNSIES